MDFVDRTVVVTGGTGALGGAVVRRLLASGARCVVPSRGNAGFDDLMPAERERLAMVTGCDLSNEADVERLYAEAPSLWASIHLAGGFAMAPIEAANKPALTAMLDINLITCFLCCRAAVRAMRNGGRIINVAARPAVEPRKGAGMTAYVTSKAAVVALTMALAEEVAGRGIFVNAVAPSIIDTPANRAAMPRADYAAWAKPEEIGATILFLASPENRVACGAVVPVYGRG